MQSVMQNYFGVLRRGDYMEKGVAVSEIFVKRFLTFILKIRAWLLIPAG